MFYDFMVVLVEKVFDLGVIFNECLVLRFNICGRIFIFIINYIF